VSRRDFWAILYTLVQDGLTVFVATAYLDEAERANRVGFMHQGRLIQCAAPRELKNNLKEECYRVTSPDNHKTRESLMHQPECSRCNSWGLTCTSLWNRTGRLSTSFARSRRSMRSEFNRRWKMYSSL